MACRGRRNRPAAVAPAPVQRAVQGETLPIEPLFGVDSKTPANVVLQNNITEFEWVTRNKLYPGFWGRNLNGETALTKEEVEFLHGKACRIVPIYCPEQDKRTLEQGRADGKEAVRLAYALGVKAGVAVFLDLEEAEVPQRDYLKGYAAELLENGLIPGFKANTDAAYEFDHEFSRGMQTDREVFEQCLVWAKAPTLPEYEGITTTHLLYPDEWVPFAPSGITRKDIVLWQYGKNCHPIQDNKERDTVFHLDLVRNINILLAILY